MNVKSSPIFLILCLVSCSLPFHFAFYIFFSTHSFSFVLSLRFCNADKYNFGMLYCSVVTVQCALYCVCERPTACIVLKVAFQIERREQ